MLAATPLSRGVWRWPQGRRAEDQTGDDAARPRGSPAFSPAARTPWGAA